ncbi:MAG: phage holin family protein [Acidobacteriota bacterium]|nr:phage holin family protein [Acidobacteriota bacterium]
MDASRSEQSLGSLLSDLSQQTADLVRQETRLAKAELGQKVTELQRPALLIGAGAAAGLTALMTTAMALTLLLIELGVTPWAAAVICTAILALTAFALVQTGLSAFASRSLVPDQTIHSIKETTQWLKNETR